MRNKILGLAIGEKSLFVAEVQGGDRPAVRAVAELQYPAGVSFAEARPESAHAAELGKALAKLLKEKGIAARNAVIGLPARWLLVKPKEVPAADDATVAGMLRLEAESEFSSELKDLVFDFARQSQGASGNTVLLVATQRRYLDALAAMCDAARLDPIAVTSSAIALARATAQGQLNGSKAGGERNLLVLTLGATASELTAQHGALPDAVRHLRPSNPQPPFVNELRRAVSMLGGGSSDRQLILWGDAELDARALGDQLGFPVQIGQLKSLGVDPSTACSNGDSCRYAPAVALAMTALGDMPAAVDFLHSRLAPPQPRRIPRWAYAVGGAVLLMLLGWAGEMVDTSSLSSRLQALQNRQMSDDQVAKASAFVNEVTTAQDWYMNEARYEACMRDLLLAVPNDGQTYATSLDLREPSRAIGSGDAKLTGAAAHELSGTLTGRTLDKAHVIQLLQDIEAMPQFTNLNDGPIDANYRGGDVSFSIAFDYLLPERLNKK